MVPDQASLDEVDPKLLETFSKLGIPISEQKRLAGVKNVAYDYVFDSESIATTFKKELAAQVALQLFFSSLFFRKAVQCSFTRLSF